MCTTVGQCWHTDTINRPVYMEAFEQQKNGVLLLSWIHSSDVRLHADESIFDKTLPHVVQLSSIDPVETEDWLLHSEHLNCSSWHRGNTEQQRRRDKWVCTRTWKSIRANLSGALLAIELGPLVPTHSKSRRSVSNQDRSRHQSGSWIAASETPQQQAFGHIWGVTG